MSRLPSRQDKVLTSGMSDSPVDTELFAKLKALIVTRLIIGSTLLLGTAIPLEVFGFFTTSKFFFTLVTSILVLTIIYTGLLNVMRNLVLLAYFQIIGDLLLETVILTATGGIESPFSILYVLSIIVASYLIPKRGAFIMAFIASSIFGSVILCQYRGWTDWWPIQSNWVLLPPPSFAIYIIFVNMTGYYLIAFLANNLSERLRKINILLKNRTVQYSYLWSLNKRIVNEIPTGLMIATQDGYIISMNPAAEKFLNSTREDQVQPHLDQFFPDYLVQSILQISDDENRAKKHIHYQHGTDKGILFYHLEILPLARKTQDPARIMVIITDVTDQKQLEAERRKSERWSTVAEVSAGMAHEIRNPLASISGSVEVLKDNLTLSDSETRLMEIIIRESDRLNKLISDFLNLARPKPPEFIETNVISLISDMVELIQNSPSWNSSFNVEVHCEEKDTRVEIDTNQFLQLAWNLAQNAMDAMADGGTLTITSETITESETLAEKTLQDLFPNLPYAKFSFKDTGIGMEKGVIDQIFEPFATFKRKGVGIGLAIVYRIVENHSGHIQVISKPDQGTTIIIRFPMIQNLMTTETVR